jgi:quercetin dioxygenase-like cupin family protein
MDKQAFEPATVYNLKQSVEIAPGAVVSKQFIKTKGGNITFFAFDKGQGLSEHTAPFDAVVQVMEGIAEVQIDKKPHSVREGEMILMPANVPHALHATEAFKMCLIMIKEIV